MDGDYVKKKLLGAGFQPTILSKKLGITHQAMSARLATADVKVNFLLDLCRITELPLSYFLDEVPLSPDVKTLDKMLKQKDSVIMKQAEEIGRLKAKIEYLEDVNK
jgi:hypothetical protein